MPKNKQLFNMKIEKETVRKRLSKDNIQKIESIGLPIYMLVLLLVSMGLPFRILICWIVFIIMTILLIFYLIIGGIRLINVSKLKAKVKKLPLTDKEVMMNFGSIEGKEVEKAEAFKCYLCYMKELKESKNFESLDHYNQEVLVSEIETIEKYTRSLGNM